MMKNEKIQKKYWETQTKIMHLIKEEYPTLKFLILVCYYEALQELSSQALHNEKAQDNDEEEGGSINASITNADNEVIARMYKAVNNISFWQNFFINLLSMPRCTMRFEQKMRNEQEDKVNKESKGKEPSAGNSS